LLSIYKLATSFDLQSHYQAILNRITVGTLSGSAHVPTVIWFSMADDDFVSRK